MTRKSPRRLLAVGPGGPATGYGRVFRSLLSRLSASVEVVHFAPNFADAPAGFPYKVLPKLLPGDLFGRESLPGILAEFDPDVVLLCHDPPFWSVHREALLVRKRQTGGRPFCAFYCPIEWQDAHPGVLRGFGGLDALVLYTEFGRGVVEKAFQEAPQTMPPLHVIPHGVDTSVFYPFDRSEARRRLFPGRPELEDAFIVLNANRNCPRKRIEVTLEGFARFAQARDKVWLYLHMGMKDSGCDVLALASEIGIRDRLLVTHEEAARPTVNDEEMNIIYNACDVGLNTSTGEGWGLVAFEHAATGAAQIVPAHSACRELWSGRAALIPATGGDVRPAGTAKAIYSLYRDPALRRTLGQVGLSVAREDRFRWEAIADQWLQLFVQCPREDRTAEDPRLSSCQ